MIPTLFFFGSCGSLTDGQGRALEGACSRSQAHGLACSRCPTNSKIEPPPDFILGAEAVDAFAQEWCGERVWAHPPPHLLPQLAQLLRERPGVEAFVCTPLWPGEAWYGELLAMCAERVTFAAGSFERVAADAPPRLESWPCTVFRIVPVAAE